MLTWSPSISTWIQQGERTPAADTIVEYLTRIPACEAGRCSLPPQTVEDFRRCVLLLEAEPNLRLRLRELRALGREWAVMVDHWEELQQLLQDEIVDFQNREAVAPGTAVRLRELLAS